MAGIDTGAGAGKRRALNQELPLIPFIDFLLCLVMFLLVTAVWSEMARLELDAQVPGRQDQEATAERRELTLHLDLRQGRPFALSWKEGETVVDTAKVERRALAVGDATTYPALAKALGDGWRRLGRHRAPSDTRRDEVVLHTDNSVEFGEIAAVLDAVGSPKRRLGQQQVAAYRVSWARR